MDSKNILCLPCGRIRIRRMHSMQGKTGVLATFSKAIYSVNKEGQKEFFDSIIDVTRIHGWNYGHIVRCLNGKAKSAYKRKWYYGKG